MKGRISVTLILSLSVAVLVTGLSSYVLASDGASAFLYIPGIQGEASDPAHRYWIEVLSCDWGKVPPPRGDMVPGEGHGPAGKLCFGDFSVLKTVDESSKDLSSYCSRGVQFSHIRVVVPGKALGKYDTLILRKVKILSVRPAGVLPNGKRTEVVTLGFRQVEYQ
jgi:type VI secretion system secreted protein Hcp